MAFYLPSVAPGSPQADRFSITIASFALVSDTQNSNDIGPRIVAVERQVPRRRVGDHQLAAQAVGSPPDLRMLRKDGYRGLDLFERRAGGVRRPGEQEIDDSIEILERLGRIDYPRQRTGLGLRARRPATFASR